MNNFKRSLSEGVQGSPCKQRFFGFLSVGSCQIARKELVIACNLTHAMYRFGLIASNFMFLGVVPYKTVFGASQGLFRRSAAALGVLC